MPQERAASAERVVRFVGVDLRVFGIAGTHFVNAHGYHCVERAYGVIQRVLSLPDDADADHVDAKFRHGVLKLKVPKLAPSASEARRIEVQSG